MNRTRSILSEYGYRPKKSRGQHFLTDENALARIVSAARIRPDETVIEIGPGPGNLTRRLAAEAARVVAIEVDEELALMLKAELKADNVTVLESDVLKVDFSSLHSGRDKLKVVANLPYNITTPVLFKLLDTPELFSSLFLLLQKEVAERICAGPGGKQYGILSVRTALLADAEVALEVGPKAFSPRPKVDSALVRLSMRDKPRAEVTDMKAFAETVRGAFARRRKMLRNSFSPVGALVTKERFLAALEAVEIDPSRRPETLTVEEYAVLANAVVSER